MLILGTLTSGHARAILSLDDKELRIALSKRIIEDNLNVRQAEALAKQLQKKKPQKKKSEKTAYDIEIEKIQNYLLQWVQKSKSIIPLKKVKLKLNITETKI